jgi:beta-phosphoglucomutase-like phosphatase (HAD superfamily)
VLKASILDVDGTLLSNDAHAHSWVDAFKAFGYEIPVEKVRPLNGIGGDKLIAALKIPSSLAGQQPLGAICIYVGTQALKDHERLAQRRFRSMR